MSNLEEIKAKIKTIINNEQYLKMLITKKEISELPKIFAEKEDLEAIVDGTYDKTNGILVATNKRLVFINKTFFGSLKVEDFPLSKISSIQYELGAFLGTITIFTSGNKAEIANAPKEFARNFAEYVRNKIDNLEKNTSNLTNNEDVFEQIKKLAELKDSGILTEEEFKTKKESLLAKI